MSRQLFGMDISGALTGLNDSFLDKKTGALFLDCFYGIRRQKTGVE
jgi:hypothetical protein